MKDSSLTIHRKQSTPIHYPDFKMKKSVLLIQYIMLTSIIGMSNAALAGEENPNKINEAIAQTNATTLPTITITASQKESPQAYKSGNMDLTRSKDDVQAYTIIERKDIERSGATSVAELIQKMVLSATSTSPDFKANTGFFGSASQFNLRGLGASHTLVLVNGRRQAGTGNRGTSESTDQPNINNIPLAAIERIEILPSTASAIYGSGALGGVINVILRKNYSGNEVNIRYGNNFDGDAGTTSLSLVSGFSLEEGRTNVLFSAQKQDSNAFLRGESDYPTKGRARLLANNPSAIYGMVNGRAVAPPAGDLVNIRTVDGSPLFGSTGSSFTHIPKGYQGVEAEGLDPLKANLGKYALGQAQGVSDFSAIAPLVPEKSSESFNLSVNRDFTDKLNAYLEGGYDRSESTTVGYFYYGARPIILKAANNPFGKDIYVNFPASVTGNAESKAVNEGTRIAGGFTYDAFSDWVLAGDYSWSKTEINSIYPRGYGVGPGMGDIGIAEAANSGKLNVLRDTTSFFTNTLQFAGYVPTVTKQTMQDYSLRGNGTLFNWYAGSAKLATGLEYRTIESDGIAEWLGAAASHREQNTSAIYAEFSLPLISPDLNIPFAKSLEMQVAGRHERYDVKTAGTKLSKTTPTIGFKFSPTDWMVLRASYAEGFIPPSVSQISSPTPNASPTEITDPLRGNEKYTVQTVGGGNPYLTPETAKSTTLGLILTPSSIPNLRLSFDYYKIEKENNITSLNAQQILNDGSIYASRVTRAAAEAGDSYGVGKVTSIYTAPINALWLETSGLDSTVSYDLDSDYGRFNFNLGYTRVFDFTWQQALNAPANENLNIPSRSQAPLKHRGGASVFWQATDLLGVGWNSQYYGSYSLDVKGNPTLALEQGSDKVKHQIYHDVFARTTLFPSLVKKAHLDNAELTFGIKNLFDTKVIDMSNSNNYFSTFADPIGRQYYLNLKFNF